MTDDPPSFRRLIDRLDFISAKKTQHELELDHERELARIRTESHALVWTGTTEELTATITRWYQSGWITAASLEAALQKTSIHFIKPDGSPAITPVAARPVPLPTEPTETNLRRAFIMPLLEKHGWSILDWANEARLDHSTALDYLDNRRKQYRSTRLKLANALNVPVDQLPK
jgi:lambda repressor-like predicted transcriptional regulator